MSRYDKNAIFNLGSMRILNLIFSTTFQISSISVKNILFFQFPVGGHLGHLGVILDLHVLGPVDVELDIELGELSDMLDMVAENVMEAICQKFHVIQEDIVQV